MGEFPYTQIEENEAWFVVPIAVVAAFGGALLWCKAVCGWNNVKSCETNYWKLQVRADCK
ncbi:hypothetical protein [Streptomyces sp. NPDC093109]|uniref:hypothetical protein n=1 Tax=Streptomyces sp. NPDC093109 TaxID=3154977 RepID=UPI00344BB591